MNKIKQLKPIQEKSLELLVSGKSISETARELKIGRGAIYDWLNSGDFSSELDRLRKRLKAEVQDQLLFLSTKSLDTLADCLKSERESVKLKAAEICLKGIGLLDQTLLVELGRGQEQVFSHEQMVAAAVDFLEGELDTAKDGGNGK